MALSRNCQLTITHRLDSLESHTAFTIFLENEILPSSILEDIKTIPICPKTIRWQRDGICGCIIKYYSSWFCIIINIYLFLLSELNLPNICLACGLLL